MKTWKANPKDPVVQRLWRAIARFAFEPPGHPLRVEAMREINECISNLRWGPTVECEQCGGKLPFWFVEFVALGGIFDVAPSSGWRQTIEQFEVPRHRICKTCLHGMPGPEPRETEEAYVSRTQTVRGDVQEDPFPPDDATEDLFLEQVTEIVVLPEDIQARLVKLESFVKAWDTWVEQQGIYELDFDQRFGFLRFAREWIRETK